MGRTIKTILLYIALTALAILCLLPFWLMLINATRSGRDIMMSFALLPGGNLGANWELLSSRFNLPRGMWNSLVIAVAATLLTGYFSAITAYALAKYRFKGGMVLFGVILVFMMIPGQLGLLGFFDLVRFLGMINSYVPLIVPAIAAPGTVFFLKQYTETVLSSQLLEAARIDGAGELRIFHKIVIPIMMPGIATMSIGSFIGSWNSYLVPMLLLTRTDRFTLPVLIASLNSSVDITANQGARYLALAISVLPIMIAFCFFSRYIISSISAGGVKE